MLISEPETQTGQPLPAAPPLGDAHVFARLPPRLTRSGEQVLEAQAALAALLGIDRWVGGTHLTAGSVWRWDPAARRLIRPA